MRDISGLSAPSVATTGFPGRGCARIGRRVWRVLQNPASSQPRWPSAVSKSAPRATRLATARRQPVSSSFSRFASETVRTAGGKPRQLKIPRPVFADKRRRGRRALGSGRRFASRPPPLAVGSRGTRGNGRRCGPVRSPGRAAQRWAADSRVLASATRRRTSASSAGAS
jgi:hypothetical protein